MTPALQAGRSAPQEGLSLRTAWFLPVVSGDVPRLQSQQTRACAAEPEQVLLVDLHPLQQIGPRVLLHFVKETIEQQEGERTGPELRHTAVWFIAVRTTSSPSLAQAGARKCGCYTGTCLS